MPTWVAEEDLHGRVAPSRPWGHRPAAARASRRFSSPVVTRLRRSACDPSRRPSGARVRPRPVWAETKTTGAQGRNFRWSRDVLLRIAFCESLRSGARSHLFTARTTPGPPPGRSRRSSRPSPAAPPPASSTRRPTSARSIVLPRLDDAHVVDVLLQQALRRIPAVSTKRYRLPSFTSRLSTASRVVPGIGRHDRPLLAEQPVEQRALADVRAGPRGRAAAAAPPPGTRRAAGHAAPRRAGRPPPRRARPRSARRVSKPSARELGQRPPRPSPRPC